MNMTNGTTPAPTRARFLDDWPADEPIPFVLAEPLPAQVDA